jgi:hypothetical protein
MAYNTQNYAVFGLFRYPMFWKIENMALRKLDLFPSSSEGGNLTSVTGG